MSDNRIAQLEAERDELLSALYDTICQACGSGDELDSMALTSYAEALLMLERYGMVELTTKWGRRVIAIPIGRKP